MATTQHQSHTGSQHRMLNPIVAVLGIAAAIFVVAILTNVTTRPAPISVTIPEIPVMMSVPTAVPTPLPTAIVATVVPENKPNQPGSCLILEQQYCDKAKSSTSNGSVIVGFNLPAGASVFAPFDGTTTSSLAVYKDDQGTETHNVSTIYQSPDGTLKNRSVSFSAYGAKLIDLKPSSYTKGTKIAQVEGASFAQVDGGAFNLIVKYSGTEEAYLEALYNILSN